MSSNSTYKTFWRKLVWQEEKRKDKEDKMGCSKRTFTKVMSSVRRQYPNYGLARRKKIARAIIYRRK